MKSLKNLNFEKIRNVGVRVDFNVPIDKNLRITDKTRLDRSKETINFIKNKQCNIILISHFGRPKENFDEKHSFSKLINQFEDIFELKLNFITLAESLGGVKTLISCPYSMTHASVPKKDKEDLGITENLLRLSVGIENVADLISELDLAINH